MYRWASLVLAVMVMGSVPVFAAERAETSATRPASALGAAVARAASDVVPGSIAWTIDRPVRRPGMLPALYGTYAALQVMDLVTTKRALTAGSREMNPLLRDGRGAAMIGVKAAAGAATVFFAERAWKKNRAGAIVLMAALNGATAAVVARNAQHARR